MNARGRTEPRIYTPPLRELTPETSLGFACIEYARDVLGKTLYPWQEWALVHMLEITGDLGGAWRFRFRTVLVLVSRQNGKTLLSEVIASFFLNVLQVVNVFGTSLSMDKAEEVWDGVLADTEAVPELARSIVRVSRTNGHKKMVLAGGRTYRIGAPNRRAGRGDANDLAMVDEVREHRDWDTWSAVAPSTNAKPRGMVVCFSNAGDPDSVVLRQIRATALEAMGAGRAADFGGEIDGATTGLFEWSAPEGAERTDVDALAQANPALGYGLMELPALLAQARTFPERKFRAECMCQQVETILEPPFPEGAWEAATDTGSEIAPESPVFYGIDMSADRSKTSIAVCGLRADGDWHVEVVARRVGSEWALDWFRQRAHRGIRLAYQGRGAPVCWLAEQICTIDGVERMPVEGPALSNGFGRFYDAVANQAPGRETSGTHVRHLEQPVLDLPARTAQWRQIGNGLQVIDRAKSPDDPSPLVACIMAFAAASQPVEAPRTYRTAYSDHSVVFV